MIWIEVQARDLGSALAPVFSAPPRDCAIVVEAGSLKKGTALRSAFEKMGNGASIECYPDDRRNLAALIDAEARQAEPAHRARRFATISRLFSAQTG